MKINDVFFIALAVVFAYIVISNTTRKKMRENDSIRWVILSLFVLVLGVFPGFLVRVANLIGVKYAPSLLFLVAILVLMYFVLRQTIQISELSNKVRELAQRNAIMEEEISDLNKKR